MHKTIFSHVATVIPILSAAIALLSCSRTATIPSEKVDLADPFVGTGFHGHTYPGASAPFGMVQLSPDTRTEGWDACSGYHYDDDGILGFSHTHLSGTGCADLGDFLFVPLYKENAVEGSDGTIPLHKMAFSHNDESASPGYYKVDLKDDGIVAELTASERVGVHRYTFSGKGTPAILIDLEHVIGDGKAVECSAEYEAGEDGKVHRISASRKTSGWAEGRYVFMSAEFSEPISDVKVIPSSKGIGASQILVLFDASCKVLTASVGISPVDCKGAANNVSVEAGPTGGDTFDKVRQRTRSLWEERLSLINIKVSKPTEKDAKRMKIFYTSLYHAFLCPNIMNDQDGRYRGFDGKIHSVEKGHSYYSTISSWDTFRAWAPLMDIIDPSLMEDLVLSMMDMYRRSGELPIWPLFSCETSTMIGYHSVPMILDAYRSGIRPKVDGAEVLEAMVVSSIKNKKGAALYNILGYVPSDKTEQSVSKTLEFCYDDWAISEFARLVGNESVQKEYSEKSKRYLGVFDAQTGFFRGRRQDGNFIHPFNPISTKRDYTEAIPWQYRFFVPHDTEGLKDAFGGEERILAALDSLFTYDRRDPSADISDVTGYMGQYAHGNEPSHHMAYLFNVYGRSYRTQEIVRELLDSMYDTTPSGIIGNEDCGQMSAWYILSSIGLYPLCPGSGKFEVCSPLFEEIRITPKEGKPIEIRTTDPKHQYIQDITVDGKHIEGTSIDISDLKKGCSIAFTLTKDKTPEVLSRRNPVKEGNHASAPATINEDMFLFVDSMKVSLSCMDNGTGIRYTLDGTAPTEDSPLYNGPFTISSSCTVSARTFSENALPSGVFKAEATKAIFHSPAMEDSSGLANGILYSYHKGEFSLCRDVLLSSKVAEGVCEKVDITSAPDEDHFGYIFSGYIDIPSKGVWEFALTSDDGSVLHVDDSLVVDNDSSHSEMTASGKIALEKGLHPFRLIYFEDYEGQSLKLEWRKPGDAAFSEIPLSNLYCKK